MCKQFAEGEFCDLGENCHFAHGEDELRVGPRGGMEAGDGPSPGRPGPFYKTTLCKRWGETGSCEFGSDCLFAHGEAELRQTPDRPDNFKTILCKNWEAEGRCEWGEQCRWAHGPEELSGQKRGGPSRPAGPPQAWNAQYKTIPCSKWTEGGGECDYGERCMFAHGPAELRVAGAAGRGRLVTSPQFKTVLCRQTDCSFGPACSFAHGRAELRTVQQNLAEINPSYKGTLCKYFMATGKCEFGSICQYAHGNTDLKASGGSRQQQPGNQNYSGLAVDTVTGPQFKTVICHNYQASGHCEFGQRCEFAHGQLELRTLAQNYLQLNPQYKTVMCTHFTEKGLCPQGQNCQFSHGDRELRVGAGQDKAGLCQLWLQTGICRARPHCTAAHGTGELRAAVRVGEREPTPSAPRNSKPIKVVLCQDFTRAGRCDRAAACTYAHGLAELHQYRVLQVPNYRITICQSWSGRGVCSYGETCMYAHGNHQLRLKDSEAMPVVIGPHRRQARSECGVSLLDSKRFRM